MSGKGDLLGVRIKITFVGFIKEKSVSKNILICGVGGQGTVLAAKVLSQAAVSGGQKVLSAETIGMAQRGGSVVSHVRIGSDVYSPVIPRGCADVIIAFEAAEAVRNISYLKTGGTVIVSNEVVQPVTASLSGKFFDSKVMIDYLKQNAAVMCVDVKKACMELGSSRVANMVLVGAACKSGIMELSEVKDAVRLLVKPEFYELNVRAVDYCAALDI